MHDTVGTTQPFAEPAQPAGLASALAWFAYTAGGGATRLPYASGRAGSGAHSAGGLAGLLRARITLRAVLIREAVTVVVNAVRARLGRKDGRRITFTPHPLRAGALSAMAAHEALLGRSDGALRAKACSLAAVERARRSHTGAAVSVRYAVRGGLAGAGGSALIAIGASTPVAVDLGERSTRASSAVRGHWTIAVLDTSGGRDARAPRVVLEAPDGAGQKGDDEGREKEAWIGSCLGHGKPSLGEDTNRVKAMGPGTQLRNGAAALRLSVAGPEARSLRQR